MVAVELWITAVTTITVDGKQSRAIRRLKAREETVRLRRQVLQQAETKVFLCDHSKVGKHGAYTLAHLSDMDYLVLEAPLPKSMNTGSAKIVYI